MQDQKNHNCRHGKNHLNDWFIREESNDNKTCYQLELLGLNQIQQQAIAAFQGQYISLGKLAEEMGMTILDIRTWLEEHDILQNNSFQVIPGTAYLSFLGIGFWKTAN